MADLEILSSKKKIAIHNRTTLLLLQIFAGFAISFLVLNLTGIIIFIACLMALIVIGLYKRNLVLISSLILPIATLTGFIDLPILKIPTMETPLGIYQNILAITVVLLALKGRFDYSDLTIIKPFIPYAFVLFISCMLSVDNFRSFAFIAKTYLPISLISVLLFNMLKNSRNREYFEITFVVTYIIIFIVSAYQLIINGLGFTEAYRTIDNILELKNLGENIRVASLFKHTYAFAEFNIFVFPFVFSRLLASLEQKEQFVSAIISFMIILTTIWTQQRVGLAIILMQTVAIYVLIKKPDFSRVSIVTVLKLLIFISVIFFVTFKTQYGQTLVSRIVNTFINPDNVTRVNTFINPNDITRDIGSTLVRIWRINIAWEIFLDFPILGSGLATSPELFDQYGWTFVNATGGPHNLYLLLLSETGFLGFLTFMYAWFTIIKKIYYNYRTERASNVLPAVFFCITVLLDGLFTGLLSGISITVFFIFLSYSLASSNMNPIAT